MDLSHSFAQILTQVHTLSRDEVMLQVVISDCRPAVGLATDWLIPGLSPSLVLIRKVTPMFT